MRIPLLLPAALLCAASAAFAQTSVKKLPGGDVEYWDKDGLAKRVNAAGAINFDREVQRLQKQMNASRPAGAAPVPETGRWNFQMIKYSQAQLGGRLVELTRALDADRAYALAEALGRKLKPGAALDDKKFQDEMARAARAKKAGPGTLYDAVEKRFARRREYLEEARKAVVRHAEYVKELGGSSTKELTDVAEMEISGAGGLESVAQRKMGVVLLESQADRARELSGRLTPGSGTFAKRFDSTKLDAARKAALKERAARLKTRLDALAATLEKARDQFLVDDPTLGSSQVHASASATLEASQTEIRSTMADYDALDKDAGAGS